MNLDYKLMSREPDSPFRHIPPTRQAADFLPEQVSWHAKDILELLWTVLRRRTAKEIEERAALIIKAVQASNAEVDWFWNEHAPQLPEELLTQINKHPNEAGDLLELDLPDSIILLKPDIRDKIFDRPWPAEMGWIEAEDQSILALLKVDDAVEHMLKGNEILSANCLLDAYQGCVIAVRQGGLHILTGEEYLEYVEYSFRKEQEEIKVARQIASASREKQKLRELVINRYLELRDQDIWVEKSLAKIAAHISKEYESRIGCFENIDETMELKGFDEEARGERIYAWVLKQASGKKLTLHELVKKYVASRYGF